MTDELRTAADTVLSRLVGDAVGGTRLPGRRKRRRPPPPGKRLRRPGPADRRHHPAQRDA